MNKKLSVEEFIHREISIKPSVSLCDRIMTDILENKNDVVCPPHRMVWIQVAAVAASVIIGVMLGIQIGTNYPARNTDSWNINDSQIENLALYELEYE